MRRKDIKISSFTGGHPRISVAVYATAGEISWSFSSAEQPTQDGGMKPSSPIYNLQNTNVAFVKSFTVDKSNFLVIALANTSSVAATGRIEIASHTGGNDADSKAELDEAISVPAGGDWTYHVLVNVSF